MVATSRAGQSRSINCSRASLASLGGADQLDHFIDVGDGDGEPNENMGAVTRLGRANAWCAGKSPPRGTPGTATEEVLQIYHQRAAVIERHHVGAERRLQGGEAIKLVEHDVRYRVAA